MGKPVNREKRKEVARTVIEQAMKEGQKLKSLKGLKAILAEETERRDYAEDYFGALTTEDLGTLLCEAVDSLATTSQRSSSPPPPAPMVPPVGDGPGIFQTVGPHTIVGPGNILTPAPSQQESDGLKDTSQSRTGVEDEAVEEICAEDIPDFDGDAPSFLVALYHPINDEFDLVKAVRCKQGKSFISHKVVERNKLFCRVERGFIKLCWQGRDPAKGEADKIPKTRFHVIADDKFRYDIAIGEDFDKPDPEEEEGAGSDDDDGPRSGDEGEGTSSSVDAEMPLTSRMSRPASLAGDMQATRRLPGHLPRHYSKNLARLYVDVQEELDIRSTEAWDTYQASSSRPNGATRHATSRKARSST